ncbi:MAG: hypothetical protein FWC41_00465 [Firmicutes bacterium]|nr:hypothetical protein [Bacillota bacterium]
MKGTYDLNGRIYLERDSGEVVTHTYQEALEIFLTLADVRSVEFDRDKIAEQLAEALGIELQD